MFCVSVCISSLLVEYKPQSKADFGGMKSLFPHSALCFHIYDFAPNPAPPTSVVSGVGAFSKIRSVQKAIDPIAKYILKMNNSSKFNHSDFLSNRKFGHASF